MQRASEWRQRPMLPLRAGAALENSAGNGNVASALKQWPRSIFLVSQYMRQPPQGSSHHPSPATRRGALAMRHSPYTTRGPFLPNGAAAGPLPPAPRWSQQPAKAGISSDGAATTAAAVGLWAVCVFSAPPLPCDPNLTLPCQKLPLSPQHN